MSSSSTHSSSSYLRNRSRSPQSKRCSKPQKNMKDIWPVKAAHLEHLEASCSFQIENTCTAQSYSELLVVSNRKQLSNSSLNRTPTFKKRDKDLSRPRSYRRNVSRQERHRSRSSSFESTRHRNDSKQERKKSHGSVPPSENPKKKSFEEKKSRAEDNYGEGTSRSSDNIIIPQTHSFPSVIPVISSAGGSTGQGTFIPNFNYIPFGQTQGIPPGQPVFIVVPQERLNEMSQGIIVNQRGGHPYTRGYRGNRASFVPYHIHQNNRRYNRRYQNWSRGRRPTYINRGLSQRSPQNQQQRNMQQLQNEETEADLDLEDVDDSDFEDYIEEYDQLDEGDIQAQEWGPGPSQTYPRRQSQRGRISTRNYRQPFRGRSSRGGYNQHSENRRYQYQQQRGNYRERPTRGYIKNYRSERHY